MAAVKSTCLHLFKKRCLDGLADGRVHLCQNLFISNILLFCFDRHSHSSFFKIVAIKTYVAISCKPNHLETIMFISRYGYVDRVFNLMKHFAFDLHLPSYNNLFLI